MSCGEGGAIVVVADVAYLEFARGFVCIDGEGAIDARLGAELRALDADAGTDDAFATRVLDDPCDLALSGSLLLGAEDTDGLAIDGIDEWSALEQAFDCLLGSYLVEGDGGFVACGTKLRLILNLVA